MVSGAFSFMPWRNVTTSCLLWLERGVLLAACFAGLCAAYQFWLFNYPPAVSYLTLQTSPQQVFEERFARMDLASLPPLLANSPYMASATAFNAVLGEHEDDTSPQLQGKRKRKKTAHSKKLKAARHKKAKQEEAKPQVLTFPKVTLAQLEALPGLGPKLAERLLKAQSQLPQGFQCLAQVDEVSGVGVKLLERLEPWLRFPKTREENLAEVCQLKEEAH
jgi:DNA uptake protein ComE-like DNA-binding protein